MADRISSALADEIWESFVLESSELVRRIEELLTQCAQVAPAQRSGPWLEIRRALHTLKGAASAAGVAAVKQAAHALEDRIGTEPPVDARRIDELLSEVAALWPGLLRRPNATEDAPAEEPAEAPARPPEPAATAPLPALEAGYLRMRPERIDALYNLAGELVVTRLQQSALADRLKALRDQADEAQRLFRQHELQLRHARSLHSSAMGDALRASSSELANLLTQMMHEIGSLSRELPTVNEQAAVVSANLEDGIRELRLMPLQPFFREYAQVVREVARECGKQATLAVRAEGAEIDRGVLLRLREPLLHMVRNAVVHGIEPQEQRLAAGKPEAGRVSLEARAEGNRVIIRVCDDGGGIDLEGVRRRAAALHLLDGSKELNDEALLDVLSHPGFSTRQRTDGMAGRGIGLDVARSSIHGLGGRLSLDGHSSAGTTFTIEVPITASTSIGLLVRVQEDLYGVLLNQIDRVLRASPEDVKVYEGRDTVLFQDEPVAAISLAELLGLPVPAAPPGRRPAVVLRQGKQRLLLFVDDIPGEQALVIKPLGRAFAGARLFLGGAVQADHSIVPVLQVPELFERAAARQRLPILPSVRSPARSRRGAVLVVDDSLTIRTLLRNILLAAGYQVTLAHDGESALQELARLPHCDLIITDLQMPGMDGSALCRAVRGSHQPHLPILIVTSVGADEEKRKALAAGADAYMIKSEFEQGHFLATVAQMTSPSSA